MIMGSRNNAAGMGALAGLFLIVFVLLMGNPWFAKTVEAGDRVMFASPPTTLANITTGFEANTTEGWTARIGHESVTVSSAERRSGNFSLLTANRRNAFDG